MNENIILNQVGRFISFLKKLSNQDFCDIADGTLKIEFLKQRKNDCGSEYGSYLYYHYIYDLQMMSTREQCNDYFQKYDFKKMELEGILSELGVSFNKKDTKAKLQSRIIENTVGKKLRDNAIINK